MGLEVATYITTLNAANPTGADAVAQGDDHIRLLKAVLLATFPTLNAALSAALVPSTATGSIVATNVQAALAELAAEKAETVHMHAAADLTGLGTAATRDVGTGGYQVVQLDGAGRLPSVDASQLTNLPAGIAGIPAGGVAYFAMSAAPTGWLKCNGALVSRTSYAALYAAIGTTFGVGDGITTFGLPELRGEFIRNLADGRAVDTGRVLGSAQDEAYLNHSHAAWADTVGAHTHTLPIASKTFGGSSPTTSSMEDGEASTTGSAGEHSHTITVAASTTGGTETRPRNVALLACIKY